MSDLSKGKGDGSSSMFDKGQNQTISDEDLTKQRKKDKRAISSKPEEMLQTSDNAGKSSKHHKNRQASIQQQVTSVNRAMAFKPATENVLPPAQVVTSAAMIAPNAMTQGLISTTNNPFISNEIVKKDNKDENKPLKKKKQP